MRVFTHTLGICCGAAVLSAAVSITAQGPAKKDAETILAQAREALGGEKRLAAVKNFVVTGRTRQVRGDNLVPIEFEIACELPDKYVRKDEIPAQESGPTSTGFNGEELIQLPVPVAPPPSAAPPGRSGPPAGEGRAVGPTGQPASGQPTAPQPQRGEGGPQRGEGGPAPQRGGGGPQMNPRVAAVKQDFVRLTLGMFAGSFASYPLTFTYAGQAEAPQGSADVLDVKGPANFSAKLFVNSQTHLPIMISWTAAPAGRGRGMGPGGPPGAGGPPPGRSAAPGAPAGPPAAAPPAGGAPPGGAAAPGAARGAAPAPPAAVEYRIYYADYRDVDGIQWPFRLRRATGADTTEETTFDRFRINTKIDPKKFEVRK